eukprot:CAMPEP_0116125742 /NCGR_PEP_ID=MMETSP0329-20121206/5970_1 /TAXON_ID=697910 /ORGANISM="Pseudo-nitzschia arenysensis, Strain B593" /LENGTH=581 /DNA_ID=CAMNT_0003619797 /DNA_START=119 /DNA_END=1864 /DNA_ORIENTATION=+
MVSIRKAKQTGFKLRRKGRRKTSIDAETVGLIAAALCLCFFLTFLYSVAFSESSESVGRIPESLRKPKKHPVLMETTEDGDAKTGKENDTAKRTKRMNNGMNAIAVDIAESLDCENLLKEAEKSLQQSALDMGGGFDDPIGNDGDIDNGRHRRLQQSVNEGGLDGKKTDDSIPEEKWGDLVDPERDASPLEDDKFDDGMGFNGDYDNYVTLSAKHLFCMAATENPPEAVTKEIMCDGSKRKRKTLLELWSAARSQMSEDLLKKVLNIARERTEEISGETYNLWAPQDDDGIEYMVNTLNSNEDVDRGGLNGLEGALGPGKIFVDVGSCLGLTCLVINKKYPGTKIVSVEPASPNWLLQEINLRCNVPRKEFKTMKVMLEGVGANNDEEDNMMAKLMWRPTATTATRSWTPASESKEGDEELVVRLRSLKSILAEANVIPPAHIDVLNVDCQGCEYSMIPELTEEEFEEIPTVTGQLHWGYIQPKKLPSSKRGKTTHQRLCGHENIARDTKECCAFPDLPVKSSIPGEVLEKSDTKEFPAPQITVSDVIADNLCDDFSTWTTEHLLNDVNDDFAWFELSSQA